MGEPRNEPFEAVYVELDWYDGPRAGLADVDGVPHYFRAVHDYTRPNEPDDEYLVWPVGQQALSWEREQWDIFVRWNARYESGIADTDSHPGHGGVDTRYDELTTLLESHRAPPDGARRLRAEWRPLESPDRYSAGGPSYTVRWRLTH
ncbi:hypothetical protein WEI85_05345 [Actinomycetes bacterium KLBMP 9797]